MDKKFYIVLSLHCLGLIYCNKECHWSETHTFEAKDDVEFLFTAEIRNLDGLVIDVIYENEERKNDRISISSKISEIFKHIDGEYVRTLIDSVISEGLQDIYMYVGTNTVNINCTSSTMDPVSFQLQSRIDSIKIYAANLTICEESCKIVTNIEKNFEISDIFNLTVFTNDHNPVKIKTSYSKEDEAGNHFELKPNDCTLKLNQSTEKFPCNYIYPGWNRLYILLNKTTLTINNNIVPRADINLKIMQVSGRYLVNCTKGTPKWKVSNIKKIKIPVAPTQDISIVLKSKEHFSPAFELDGNMVSLSWKDLLKIGPGQPLPPKSYFLVFKIVSKMLKIYIVQKSDQQLFMELKVDEVPEFIIVSCLEGEYQLTLQVPGPDLKPTEHITLSSRNGETNSSFPTTFFVICISLIVIAVIFAAISYVWKKYGKKETPNIQMTLRKWFDVSSKWKKDRKKETLNIQLEEDQTLMSNTDQDNEMKEVIIEGKNSRRNSKSSGTNGTQDTQAEIHYHTGNREEEDFDRIKPVIEVVKDTQDTNVELHREEENNSKEQIIHDFKELDDGIASIFDATKDRRLFGSESADSLLRKHGLPGTIRDRQGNSILHCLILTLKQDGHNEDADEIKKFLKEHNIFVSAVNYKGQTALHTLASEASKEDSSNKWESMAKLLIDIGCNSGIRDNNNQLPDDVASAHGCKYLQDLIRQKRDVREELDMKTKKDQWLELLKATKENKIDLVTDFLQANNPILPLYAIKDRDPLKAAIQGGHTELTMLLLSAGAPLCGRPLKGLNPLEVSHETPGLPVRLPALIRREYYNCLRSESEMLKDDKGHMNLLKERVIELAESVKIDGYTNATLNLDLESKDRSQRSEEARKMLSLAAEWGMGLTCQMLGLEDVFLHPLLHEISPDKNAKPNTLDVLYRDLELSLSFTKKREYEEYNMEKLRVFCKKNDISINSLSDVQTPINKEVLKFIAEEGLHMAYEKIFLKRNAQVINSIVDEVTGFTMLHSAAYSDRMGMVEFLLMHEADERMKTDKGFTAAHVAAIRGHRECMEYILHISELRDSHISRTEKSLINDKTKSGLTAREISNVYASEIKNVHIFLLHESISHPILSSYSSEPKCNKQAKLVLSKKKSIIEECFSKGSLKHIIPPIYIKEQNGIWKQLKEESENFIQTLSDTDPRFKGRIIYPHKSNDALELMLMDSYQIYLELENNEHWDNHNLHKSFKESGLKAMMNFTVKSNNLCLLPTVFKASAIGANIRLSYCSRQICYQLCIHVIPVLKTKFHCPQQLPVVPQKFDVIIAKTPMTHKVFNRKEKWSYVTTDLENKLLDEVDDDKLKVLSLCRFIKKLLDSPWWFPRVESRRHGRQWHHYAVSHPFVEERFLVSSFLLEVFKHPEQIWNNQHIADRVLGVFENMVVPDAHCFLDQGKDVITVSSTIIAIIEFLRKLK